MNEIFAGMRSIAISIVILTCCVVSAIAATEVDPFLERFALGDRKEALSQLIPGTHEWYFYHCIDSQHRSDFARVDQLVKDWTKQHRYSEQRDAILMRQALLLYNEDPAGSISYLKNKLGISFHHRQPGSGVQENIPSRLDQNLISRQAFERQAALKHKNDLSGYTDDALELLNNHSWKMNRKRDFLRRVKHAEIPGIIDLIIDELRDRHSGGFGSLPIHYKLLLSQLQGLQRQYKEVADNDNFIHAMLVRLQPRNGSDWRINPAEREAYLDRLWAYAQTLPKAHDSLKANVLYHRLIHDRSSGVFDHQRFLAYIALPRQAFYINRNFIKGRQNLVNLNASYQEWSLLPPIGNDGALISSYLEYFFKTASDYKEFNKFLSDRFLRRVFAETKVTAGQGDQETWASWLGAEQYREIQDRVELDFTPQNKTKFTRTQEVQLQLQVKNVDQLLVRVYPINTLTWYKDKLSRIPADFDVDGLVSRHEQTIQYSQHPALRHVENINIPAVNGAGVYIVECLGNGYRCRAMIYKGDLRVRERTGTAGHVLTVFNEQNKLIGNASVWLGGHRVTADKKGEILVPFATAASSKSLVIEDQGFAVLYRLNHLAEEYHLEIQAHLEQQQALAGMSAQVLVRPHLLLHGEPVGLQDLEQVRLTLTAETLDGIKSSSVLEDAELKAVDAWTHTIQLPERVRSLSVLVNAEIKKVSTGEKLQLQAGKVIHLNSKLAGDQFNDCFLRSTSEGFVIDVLGRNGEAYAGEVLQKIHVTHRDFTDPVYVVLKSDSNGAIHLGELDGIKHIKISRNNKSRSWNLPSDNSNYSSNIHASTNDTITLPWPYKQDLLKYVHLFSLRGKTRTKSFSQNCRIGADGRLKISELPAGDYELLLPLGNGTVHLLIEEGTVSNKSIFGKARILSANTPHALHINKAVVDQNNINVKLIGASKATRVHLVATRFLPDQSIYGQIGHSYLRPQEVLTPPLLQSQFLAMKRLSDEHRYIIERSYENIFPGIMLERPALLLNPWERTSTETEHISTQGGEKFDDEMLLESKRKARKSRYDMRDSEPANNTPVYDFLATGALVLANLIPDGKGVISIPRNKLGQNQFVQIIAVEPEQSFIRHVQLPQQALQRRERRLMDVVPGDSHQVYSKDISILSVGEKVSVNNDPSTWRMLDTIGQAYELLDTLCDDDRFDDFTFIKNWPSLSDDEKLRKYNEYACHELNIFLYHKDRAFFDTNIKEGLQNKHDKTFIDYYLLEADLSAFTSPWAFERLNAYERICLSQRLAQQAPGILRSIKEALELIPPDPGRDEHLFFTALRGKSLDADNAVIVAGSIGGGADKNGAEFKKIRRLGQMKEELEHSIIEKAMAPAPAMELSFAEAEEGDYFDEDRSREQRQLFRQMDKTREWAENNYYKRYPAEQLADLIKVNDFWADYSENVSKSFLSKHLAQASSNAGESIIALALIDLPFASGKHEIAAQNKNLSITPSSTSLLYHLHLVPADFDAQQLPLAVNQNCYRKNDRYRYENGQQIDHFVDGPLLYRDVYGTQVVITNPTARPQNVQIFIQIPKGAIPLGGHQEILSKPICLTAYSVQRFEVEFYFPEADDFQWYSAKVAKDKTILGTASTRQLSVQTNLQNTDADSWQAIADLGSNGKVLQFLRTHNLQRLDLKLIAFRMQEKDMFNNVLNILRTNRVYDSILWSYGFKHMDAAAMRTWLKHNDRVIDLCGDYLQSPLLNIDAVEHLRYEHLEFYPLVNARSHSVAGKKQIANNALANHYNRYLAALSYLPAIPDEHRPALIIYLLAQERVSEAVRQLDLVNPADTEQQLQYDYCKAYLAMVREDLAGAEGICKQYASFGILRWRNKFDEIAAQIAEIRGAAPQVIDEDNRQQELTQRGSVEAMLDLEKQGNTVILSWRNIKSCTVNYYLMDLELLFSRNPFMRGDDGQFAYVEPNYSMQVNLPEDETRMSLALPQQFQKENVVIEASAAGLRRRIVLFAHNLHVQTQDNYGQLQVRQRDGGAVLAKAYVKVYARMSGGEIRFYKDGYTDLRGRFDYASLSTNDLDNTEQFALFIQHPEHGNLVREVNPPQR